jgi:S1-C subfamily serine protease
MVRRGATQGGTMTAMERAGTFPPAARPSRRLSAVALGVIMLAVGGAAVGFLVTGISAGGVNRAGQWVVGLRTTLDSGATITGTGIVLTASGQVVTTYGVVDGAVSIAAQVNGGSRYAASTFALDPSSDVAVLQLLNAADVSSAGIGNSSDLGLGDAVTAIGFASIDGGTAVDSPRAVTGLESTTDAALSGTSDSPTLDGLIECNAPLPERGAGGPLVDASGALVGLDTGTIGSATLAIPIDRVLSIVSEVDAHKTDPAILEGHGAYLGIEVQDSTAPPGARITDVAPGTPAQIVGIAPSDVIVSIDGAPVESIRGLSVILSRYSGGDHVVVDWLDPDGHLHSATTQLAAATFT